MYFVVKQVLYNPNATPTTCAINLARRWGLKKEKEVGWKSFTWQGPRADALSAILKPGDIVDITGGGRLFYPPKLRKRRGGLYGD